MYVWSQVHNEAAILFVIFWVLSLTPSMKSWEGYWLRTVPVVAYSMFTVAGHNKDISSLEWLADGLVWYHFFSAIFLVGKSMQRKRVTSGQ